MHRHGHMVHPIISVQSERQNGKALGMAIKVGYTTPSGIQVGRGRDMENSILTLTAMYRVACTRLKSCNADAEWGHSELINGY